MDWKKTLATIAGLWVLVWLAYSGSLTASWHLDDIPSIVRNPKLHLTQLTPDALVGTFFAGTSGKIYRPVPMASFAVNWYLGGANVIGYRAVNIAIHCINGMLVFLILVQLLQAPRLSGAYTRSEIHWAALLAALLWALNPVQTQAITYIVQRMAAMAGLFYLIGIYLFACMQHPRPGGRAWPCWPVWPAHTCWPYCPRKMPPCCP